MNATSKIEAETLYSAMAAAFAEIESATKAAPGQVGQQKYKYADLTSVIEAIKPALVKHNLFFTQCPEPVDGGVCIATHLYHVNGHNLPLGKLFVPANKNDAQSFGSALTYARRYALVTAFGVPVEDDDGNAAARGQGQGATVSPTAAPAKGENWGGRYPTKTALWKACKSHHVELDRLGMEATFDDLDAFLTSPEYVDYVAIASKQVAWLVDGPAPADMPEFIPTFQLEQKARDLIALRGNTPVYEEETA